MKILLDLEDRPYVLKQLAKLYGELPKESRSRKSVLPASELILEATEYISYLKGSHGAAGEPRSSSILEKEFPSELTEYFAESPQLYDTLRRLKSIEELKILSELLREPPGNPSKTPCFSLEAQSALKAHVLVYKAVREPQVENIRRSCNTSTCINPQHYFEHCSDVFLRTLSKRVVKGDSSGARPFLASLLKKINTREVRMLIKGFSGDHKECFPVPATSFPHGGVLHVKQLQLQEYVQQLLFKTFRFHSWEGELTLISSDACSLSMGKSRDESLLCFNPWHFEPLPKKPNESPNKEEHTCVYRLLVSPSAAKYVCRLCAKEDPLESKGEETKVVLLEEEESAPPLKSPKASQSTPKPPRSSKPKISPILRERSTRKRKVQAIFQCWKCLFKFTTNSELENHPCSSKQRFHDDEDEEIEKPADKVLQIKIERLDHDYGSSPPSKKAREDPEESIVAIKEEVLDEDEYETCLFDEKVAHCGNEARENIALIEDRSNSSTCVIYTCQFCGFCSVDFSCLNVHRDKCRDLGLKPLPGLTHNKNTNGGGGEQKEESGKSNCSSCRVTFANSQELRLHAMKSKCRSIQCGECSKFYTTSRTFQHHLCEGINFEESDGILYFKVENTDSWFVDCGDCGLRVPSRRILSAHQSSLPPVFCHKCESEFPSVCKFLVHPCIGDERRHLQSSSSLKHNKYIHISDLSKTYKCEICAKAFVNDNTLHLHRNRVHGSS